MPVSRILNSVNDRKTINVSQESDCYTSCNNDITCHAFDIVDKNGASFDNKCRIWLVENDVRGNHAAGTLRHCMIKTNNEATWACNTQ